VHGQNGTTLKGRTTMGFGARGSGLLPTREAEMNSATKIMYAASSLQSNHVGAGLVPAHKAMMNLATTQIMYATSSPQFNDVGAGLVPAH
jgi:hypothetical protein